MSGTRRSRSIHKNPCRGFAGCCSSGWGVTWSTGVKGRVIYSLVIIVLWITYKWVCTYPFITSQMDSTGVTLLKQLYMAVQSQLILQDVEQVTLSNVRDVLYSWDIMMYIASGDQRSCFDGGGLYCFDAWPINAGVFIRRSHIHHTFIGIVSLSN